jgi:diaminopimelate epimerase
LVIGNIIALSIFTAILGWLVTINLRFAVIITFIRIIALLDRTSIFPSEVNVDFVQVTDSGIVKYRCFERVINRETLACGTVALVIILYC